MNSPMFVHALALLSLCAAPLSLACGDDTGETSADAASNASSSSVGGTTAGTSGSGTGGSSSTSAGPAGSESLSGTSSTGASTAGSEGSTGPQTTSTGATTEASTTGGETTTGACEDQPEICDALDNNCNDLYDEGCDCTPPDLELNALEGYTARVILDIPEALGTYGFLGDVERALGDYWAQEGEGVLFSVNNPGNTASGIGVLNQDGEFQSWLLDPADGLLPINPYLEYAYGGVLYACTTVNGNWIYRIFPDGTVEQVVQHGNCEGLIYGDRGDGVMALYASNYSEDAVYRIDEDGTRTLLASGPQLNVVVDLAIPPASSMFTPGLYAINQLDLGVHRIDPDNSLTLAYPYALGYGVGEEISFADPLSAFRDHFYHLSATLQAVVRIKPDGTWEEILTGPKLNYGLYSTGAVFSSNGAYLFFTNEDELIMRLQACNAQGQID